MKTKIKKTVNLVLILCLTLIVSVMNAQKQGHQGGGQQGPPPIPTDKEIKEMVSDLSDEISLSEDQETEILGLYTAHFKEVEEKTKSGRPDRKEMETLRTDFDKEVNAGLTKEQQKQYATYQKEHRAKRKEQHRKG